MANQFRPGLNFEAQKVIHEEREQEKLHEKYKNVDKKTTIKVSSPLETFWSIVGSILKVVCFIIMVILTAIGIAALLVPESREALIKLLDDTVLQIKTMLGTK